MIDLEKLLIPSGYPVSAQAVRDEIIRLRSDLARARKALEDARAFIDPDVSPPRKTNRELVVQINAALTEIAH